MTRLCLRILALACILGGLLLMAGCVTDSQGNTHLFGFGPDHKFSTTQAAADTQDPQIKAQASLLGPFGPIGLEIAGVALYAISHLNKRVDSATLKHAIRTGAPQIVDGLLKAIPDDPAPAASPIVSTPPTAGKTG